MIAFLKYMFAKPSKNRITVDQVEFCPISGYTEKGKLTFTSFKNLKAKYAYEKFAALMQDKKDRFELWRNSRLKRLIKIHLGDITVEQYDAFVEESNKDLTEFML